MMAPRLVARRWGAASPREQKRRRDVEAEGFFENPLAGLEEGDVGGAARVVDEDIETPVGLDRLREQSLELITLFDVAYERARLAPHGACFFRYGFDIPERPRGHDDIGAGLRVGQGDAAADTLTAPRDEGRAPIQAKSIEDHAPRYHARLLLRCARG